MSEETTLKGPPSLLYLILSPLLVNFTQTIDGPRKVSHEDGRKGVERGRLFRSPFVVLLNYFSSSTSGTSTSTSVF